MSLSTENLRILNCWSKSFLCELWPTSMTRTCVGSGFFLLAKYTLPPYGRFGSQSEGLSIVVVAACSLSSFVAADLWRIPPSSANRGVVSALSTAMLFTLALRRSRLFSFLPADPCFHALCGAVFPRWLGVVRPRFSSENQFYHRAVCSFPYSFMSVLTFFA